MLSEAQRRTCKDYSGSIISADRATGEYSDESMAGRGYAATVLFSSGWTATIGRYGAVLSEHFSDQG